MYVISLINMVAMIKNKIKQTLSSANATKLASERLTPPCHLFPTVHVEPELLHTYSKVYKADVLLLIVRLAVLTAVTLTVPVVLFPVSVPKKGTDDGNKNH